MYDVIVAGAGPAGAGAAYYLGQAGYKVLVLEKEALPRYKTCGGGVSIRTLEKYFQFSFEPVIECQAQSLTYYFGDQSARIMLSKPSMVTVMRDRFDAYILEHAQADVITQAAIQGVTEEADQVIVKTQDGRSYSGRFLLGADGANSMVARMVGLRRGKVTAAAVEAEVPVPPAVVGQYQTCPAFIFGEVRNGYGWIFPKAHHLSVGVVILHPKPGEIQSVMGRIADRFHLPIDQAEMRGHPVPIHMFPEPIATRRVLLLGDAAGLADPLSGEGIRMAIKSARLASQAIILGRTDLYSRWVESQIGRDLRIVKPLGRLFYRFPGICHYLGERNPFATQAFMDMLSDEASYSQVILRTLVSVPAFLLTEVGAGLLKMAGFSRHSQKFRERIYLQ